MILLEEVSPNGNVTAVVEEDGRSAYFYLNFHDAEPGPGRVKACWVRNLATAPAELDVDAMRDGNPPMLPAPPCRHPEGLPPPSPGDLTVVWFEEGDAAALLEGAEILAVLPSWAGLGNFPGYARDCIAENPLCWPLPVGPSLAERIRLAREYWGLWDDDSFWEEYRDALLAPIEAALGRPHAQYFAIDQGQWPPKAILRFDLDDRSLLITLGVSVRPQPGVELVAEDPIALRRIELAAAFDPECPSDEVLAFGRYLSAQSGYPWVQGTWLGEGHSLPCDSVPPALGGPAFGAVLLTAHPAGAPRIDLPAVWGDPILLLWMIPITPEERELAVRDGSDALLGRLIAAGVGGVHRLRESVV